MCHIAIEDARVALHWIRWGNDRSIDAVVLFPPVDASWGDVEELADVFRSVLMRDEPEGALLQVFADVAINHEGRRSLPDSLKIFFFKMAHAKVYGTRCNDRFDERNVESKVSLDSKID